MMELQPKEKCFGCGACGAICPREAISFSPDKEGFLYPSIDAQKCVSCGLCQKVCPVGKEIPLAEGYPKAYAAKHKSGEVLYRSSSGGMFTALSDLWALHQGGTVYGAAFDRDFQVHHLRAQDAAGRAKMRGSKYPQSRLAPEVYHALEQDLRSQKDVVFSATPCQIAGVRSYLACKKVPLEQILFVDLVCHGAASPAVWRSMLQAVSEKYGALKEVSFRAKDEGVSVHLLKLVTASGDITQKAKKEYAFYNVYSSLCMMRPSCYSCPYSSLKRQGDFTIGDYADLKRQHPDFFCEEGGLQPAGEYRKGGKTGGEATARGRIVKCSACRGDAAEFGNANEMPCTAGEILVLLCKRRMGWTAKTLWTAQFHKKSDFPCDCAALQKAGYL